MYTLVSSLLSQWRKRDEYAVLVLGLDNAGKTTLVEQIKRISKMNALDASAIVPTVGQNVCKVRRGRIVLTFWDLGGQENLRTLWASYYSECHALVFVIDSADPERLEECCNTIETVVADDSLADIPVLALANKQDAPGALPVETIKERGFNRIAETLDASEGSVLAVSALNGDGVETALEWLETRVVRNKQTKPPRNRRP